MFATKHLSVPITLTALCYELKTRFANETESNHYIFQEEQNKFIESKAVSLDLNQEYKLFSTIHRNSKSPL